MLIIYNALNYDNIDRANGEKAERFEWLDSAEALNGLISMGSDRPWNVIEIHTYQNGTLEPLKLAIVHPQNELVPTASAWDIMTMKAQAFNVELAPDGNILGYEWDFIGRAPTIGGRLMEAKRIDHPTQLREVSRNWVISKVDLYSTDDYSPYPLIRLCWCVAYREPIAV